MRRAALLIVLALAVGVSAPAHAGIIGQWFGEVEGATFTPPSPSFAKMVQERAMVVNGLPTQVRLVQVTAGWVKDPVAQYAEELAQSGWKAEPQSQQSPWSSSMIVAKKGRSWVVAAPAPVAQDRTWLVICTYSEPVEPSARNDVALDAAARPEDVAGPDARNVPRYPGSARIQTIQNGLRDTSAVMYASPDGVAAIAEFYQQELPLHGWELAGQPQLIADDHPVVRSVRKPEGAQGLEGVRMTFRDRATGALECRVVVGRVVLDPNHFTGEELAKQQAHVQSAILVQVSPPWKKLFREQRRKARPRAKTLVE